MVNANIRFVKLAMVDCSKSPFPLCRGGHDRPCHFNRREGMGGL